MKKFNINLSDSQASQVSPVSVRDFDFDRYSEYTEELNIRCDKFWKSTAGILVYRRMRVAQCFSFGCSNMQNSLEYQLGALQKSMHYISDVPNFLEPWYGIGTIASAFGGDYEWPAGNAPVMKPRFKTVDELLAYEPKEVAKTNIGRHTLDMIDYFMENTKGRLPVSLTDTQSPLNIVNQLIPLDGFFYEFLMCPDKILKLFDILADLSISFNKEQVKRIGHALVYPGHGFASSSKWKGLGMSDDNAVMISPEQYLQLAAPSVEKIGMPFGGPVFHSCGDWSGMIGAVLGIKNIRMADGAFSAETDPGATDNLESFHKFAHTGVVLNARIVGDPDTVENQVRRLWVPGMKLIVVTYCNSPEEQESAYDKIHHICQNK
ncbi:MAG: uroporphyrinogen decarboxylase family protein [Bacteroidales bacterium]